MMRSLGSGVRWPSWGLLALAIATFTGGVLAASVERLQPVYDEVSYLAVAREYAREGGVVPTIGCYLAGNCQEENHHPLYELVLAVFATDDAGFFARAKFVTLGTSFLLFVAAFASGWRQFTPAVAIGTVVTLCLLTSLVEHSARVLCDVLFAGLSILSVTLIAEAQDRRAWAAVAAGAVIGLAYLAKGSGYLFFVPLVAVGLHSHGVALFRRPLFYGAVAGFAAVSFFLLWRNVIVFGAPLHNLNNHAVWLDNWSDIWTLSRGSEWDRVGLLWYLERHSLWDLLIRLTGGFALTTSAFVNTIGVTVPGLHPLARQVVGWLLLLLAVLGMGSRFREGRRSDVLSVVCTTIIFVLAFSLGAQGLGGVHERFMLPLVVLFVPYAVFAVVEILVPALPKEWRSGAPWLQGLLGVVLAVQLASTLGALGRPLTFVQVPENWRETSRWLRSHLEGGEGFALPSYSLYSTFDDPGLRTDASWAYTFQSESALMIQQMKEANIHTVLVDMHDADVPLYEDKLSADRDAKGPKRFLAWPRCFADSGSPSRFLAYCRPVAWTAAESRSFVDVPPPTGAISFETSPPGLTLIVEGRQADTPLTFAGTPGARSTIAVASPQMRDGLSYAFSVWSDGSISDHDVVIPRGRTTYTAYFRVQDQSRSGRISAGAEPLQVCDGSGLGAGTVTWESTGTSNVEVRVGSPAGPMFSRSITGKWSQATGRWLTHGLALFLQDRSAANPLNAENTLAVTVVTLTARGCPDGIQGNAR
jgi:hypothetical protein